MSKELQNEEFYLKGDLGNVIIGSTGERKAITNFIKHKDGSGVTLTLSKIALPQSNETEDIPHEVVQPKQIENGSSKRDKNKVRR